MQYSKEQVYEKVKQAIVDSSDVEMAEIEPGKALIHDLGIDSIDLISLIFHLEKSFQISIPVGDIERKLRQEMGEIPLEKDGILTAEGLSHLRRRLPEVPEEKFQPGLSVHQIPYLLTVESVQNLVLERIQAPAGTYPPPFAVTPPAAAPGNNLSP